MLKLEMKDRTKTSEIAVYYMEEKDALQEFWQQTEQTEFRDARTQAL